MRPTSESGCLKKIRHIFFRYNHRLVAHQLQEHMAHPQKGITSMLKICILHVHICICIFCMHMIEYFMHIFSYIYIHDGFSPFENHLHREKTQNLQHPLSGWEGWSSFPLSKVSFAAGFCSGATEVQPRRDGKFWASQNWVLKKTLPRKLDRTFLPQKSIFRGFLGRRWGERADNTNQQCPWKIECFLDDLFVGS